MANILLIDLPYLGNISFYKLLIKFKEIRIEKQEFYQKASYRNRCEISGANGRLSLSIPIVGGKDKRQFYKETKISYDHNWIKDHWNSLCSAYRRSPYFEYYEDHFESIYFSNNMLLFDFNIELFKLIIDLLKLNIKVSFTSQFDKVLPSNFIDKRGVFLPKIKEHPKISYHQVFEDRNGFIENMSIIDLLFNEGPNSLNILEN